MTKPRQPDRVVFALVAGNPVVVTIMTAVGPLAVRCDYLGISDEGEHWWTSPGPVDQIGAARVTVQAPAYDPDRLAAWGRIPPEVSS